MTVVFEMPARLFAPGYGSWSRRRKNMKSLSPSQSAAEKVIVVSDTNPLHHLVLIGKKLQNTNIRLAQSIVVGALGRDRLRRANLP
jgi:hypothetical protein